jgi:hypothetical protein
VKEEGQWRMRYNKELYELYKDVDLVTFIKKTTIGRPHTKTAP